MAVFDGSDVRALVESLTAPGATLGADELDKAYRLCLAVHHVLQDRCASIVAGSGDRPVISVYQSDGWSCRMSAVHRESAGGSTVVREGRLRRENLLERGIVRSSKTGGHVEFGMILGPPRSLIHGRTAWHIFSAATEFTATLRAQQHAGVALQVYLMDGCSTMYSAQEKLVALHELWYTDCGGSAVGDRWAQRQLEWIFPIRCVVHAAHLGVKWGLRTVNSVAISDDAHVALRGVLSSSESILQKVDEFCRRYIDFDDRGHAPDQVREFWTTMDIPAGLLELFIRADPWWDVAAQRLKMQPWLEHDPDCWSKVRVIMLTVRRWIVWSDTRWARCGRAGRFFMRSVGTGLDAAVKECLSDPQCETFYLSCWSRASKEVRLMLTSAALACVPIEHFVLEMLKDDRLLLHGDRVHQEVVQMLSVLASTSALTWARAAQVADAEVYEIRHTVLTAAMTSYGFLINEVYTSVWEEPLALCRGNSAANVAALQARPGPVHDERVRRMKNLPGAGYPLETVVEGLRELVQIPFSTKLVEEAHASAAIIMRKHERYSEGTMRIRSLLHGVRTWVRLDQFEKKLERFGQEGAELGSASTAEGRRLPALHTWRSSCPRRARRGGLW